MPSFVTITVLLFPQRAVVGRLRTRREGRRDVAFERTSRGAREVLLALPTGPRKVRERLMSRGADPANWRAGSCEAFPALRPASGLEVGRNCPSQIIVPPAASTGNRNGHGRRLPSFELVARVRMSSCRSRTRTAGRTWAAGLCRAASPKRRWPDGDPEGPLRWFIGPALWA